MSGSTAPVAQVLTDLLGRYKSFVRAWAVGPWDTPQDLAEAPHAHSFGPVRVLVVDDNPVKLSVISALMESRGLVPLLAADGAEAVALASEVHFDLILMDLQMPILDGLRATSAIRRFETSCSRPPVPVVAYSAASTRAGVLTTHGFNGRLTKPCSDQDLEDCLVRWCPTYRAAPAQARRAADLDLGATAVA